MFSKIGDACAGSILAPLCHTGHSHYTSSNTHFVSGRELIQEYLAHLRAGILLPGFSVAQLSRLHIKKEKWIDVRNVIDY